MRIHSDILTPADLERALITAALNTDGVYLRPITQHGSRKRRHALEVALRAHDGKDRNGKVRTWPNSGSYGSGTGMGKAATYDEWGYWIAALYAMDPDAVVGPYADAADFAQRTNGSYPIVAEG